jgi:hypothetical protein
MNIFSRLLKRKEEPVILLTTDFGVDAQIIEEQYREKYNKELIIVFTTDTNLWRKL